MEKKIRTEFRLVGLSKPFSATCRTPESGSDECFWPKLGIPRERFDALWDYCKGNWGEHKMAVIEHNGLSEDGTPINGVIVEIFESKT